MSDREGSFRTMDRDHSPRRDMDRVKNDRTYSRSERRGGSRDYSPRRSDVDRIRAERRGGSRDYSPRRSDVDRIKKDRSYSRSRSRSRSVRRDNKSARYSRSRSGSRSASVRRRHPGTRENPKPNSCLGVFGLSVYTTEVELYHLFNKYGPVARVQVVIDAKTGRSRGFAFVYFQKPEDAKVAKDQCSGLKINGRSIRVDFSLTERPHTPTPGIYMGKPTYRSDRFDSRSSRRDRDSSHSRSSRYRRTPSPYYSSRSRRRNSRSRSYSPRRY